MAIFKGVLGDHARIIAIANAGSCSIARATHVPFEFDKFHLRLTAATRSKSIKFRRDARTLVRDTVGGITLAKDAITSIIDVQIVAATIAHTKMV